MSVRTTSANQFSPPIHVGDRLYFWSTSCKPGFSFFRTSKCTFRANNGSEFARLCSLQAAHNVFGGSTYTGNGAALSICDTAQVPPFQTPPTSRQSWPKHQRLTADAPATSNRHHLPRLPSSYVQPAKGSSVQCSVLTRTAAPAGLHMLMVGKAIFTAR